MGFVIQEKAFLFLMSHKNILVNCHIREKRKLLVDDSDTFCTGCIGILEVNLLAVHVHLAC